MSEKYLYKPIHNSQNNYVVWMGFPGKTEFSLSSLGYLWMFKEIDEYESIDTERICTDTEKTIYKKPDIFGFSFYFDFDFLEIFKILEKYNIPIKSSDRNSNHPLIFAGGPVVTANPSPYNQFFDFFIIGDGEDVNLNVIKFLKENKNTSKEILLDKLSKFEGVYVPHISKKVIKSTKRLNQCIYTPIISDNAYFKNTFIIEMSRGCSNRCGFCLASYINLPFRPVPFDNLSETIKLGLKHTNKIAFLGAQVSAHPKFNEICDYIYERIQNGENIEMNFSSLRVDAITPNVIKTLVAAGQKNITLAIEAGSERLRKIVNKNLTNEQLFNAVNIAKKNGLKGIKLYGMIGIPTETQEDITAIIELAKEIKSQNNGLDISFGFSSFVPKAQTPFQWLGRENSKTLEKKALFIQKELHKIGIQCNLPSIKWDYWQAVLSRGDENLTEFLINVYKDGGKLGAFKNSAKKLNIDTDYYAYENYLFDKELTWDFIEMKPLKNFLINENKRLIPEYNHST